MVAYVFLNTNDALPAIDSHTTDESLPLLNTQRRTDSAAEKPLVA